ncbi:hypothetical protein OPV22_012566 [Ensete ventricosum]|uniref:Uncharacterized protein n=1 Tax=Ensete ventricosum TaxID=4639 RepID=A0AAV8QXE5_ENSVE|nr:hypothetical protein OPV22_012566 [Ensete ventricosum]
MVISAETPATPPDPAVAMATKEASVPRGGTRGSLLNNFSFPILETLGSHEALRCMSGNGEGKAVAGAGRRSTGSSEVGELRIRVPSSGDEDDPGIEEVREKLLVHLREAADRMKRVVQHLARRGGVPEPARAAEARPSPEADTSAALPWNLRTRRGAARSPMGTARHLSGSPTVAAEKRNVRLRLEAPERRERPKFSISLTREEIEEDIYALTARRAPRRPRRRPRAVQKQLESLFPGSSLSEINAVTYRVPS